MDITSDFQHGHNASIAGSEIKEEKLKDLSGHGCNDLLQIPRSNNGTESLVTSLNKRNLEKVMSNSPIDHSLSVTEQTAENNAVSTKAQVVTPAKKRKGEADFLNSRGDLTDAQRRTLEKLDGQNHCFARCTKISNEPMQLRPVTLLHNEAPILLFRTFVYNHCDRIAITLDAEHFCSQASYKDNASSCNLRCTELQLKNLSKLQLQIVNKLQERSERINQPVYLSASSGKLRVESDKVYFSKPKQRGKICNSPVLSHNESLVAPYEPSDVQSILVPKIEFMLHLDQVLTNKSVYERKHGLIDLPITIYDVQTGERIHCYERQLFNPEEKKKYFKKVNIFRFLLQFIGINPYNLEAFWGTSTFQALNGVSPIFFMNFILSLSSDFFRYVRNKEEILKLIDNLENKVDLKTLCNHLSDGANLNFTVKGSYSYQFFINHVIELLIKTSKKKLSKDLIENQQSLMYILMHHPKVKAQFHRDPKGFPSIPEHLQSIFFIIMPDYVHQSALNLEFFGKYDLGYSIDRTIYLHCAGYLLENMNDSLCTKLIEFFVEQCIFPSTFNSVEGLYFKKNCLTILLHWKPLNKLEPEILSSLKKWFHLSGNHHWELTEQWRKLGVDLTPIFSSTLSTEEETKNIIINKLAHLFYSYHMNYWGNYFRSDEFKRFQEDVKQANKSLLTLLPDHLNAITLPKITTLDHDFRLLLESLKLPFLQPLGIPDINDFHQATRAILDRYYRTLGPERVVDIENLGLPARSHLQGSGHALRVAMNIRLLMQLLQSYDLADLSLQQKQLLEYAAIYHDAAAEDVNKDREVMASAGYFRRDMTHNCPAIYKDDILAIAEAMEHLEDDIHHEENAAINPQQRLYRRLLRFADRLDSARYLSIPEDFPNFERRAIAGEVDARLLDIDAQWLNHENFKKTLVSCIHGLLDLAAVSGGATQDHRTAKGYIKNYQLNPDASEKLDRFFEKTPKPLKALEDLMDDNVRRFIAQRAGLTTCADPEHRQCGSRQEHQRGVVFGYTRIIHNRYHDLVQVDIPEMQLWEKLAVTHAHELLSPELQSAIDDEQKRLREVGIKRNIGNPSQETLAVWEIQQFLKNRYGLKVVAESKLREVIPAAVEGDKVNHRHETILMLKAQEPAGKSISEKVQIKC